MSIPPYSLVGSKQLNRRLYSANKYQIFFPTSYSCFYFIVLRECRKSKYYLQRFPLLRDHMHEALCPQRICNLSLITSLRLFIVTFPKQITRQLKHGLGQRGLGTRYWFRAAGRTSAWEERSPSLQPVKLCWISPITRECLENTYYSPSPPC